MKRIASASLMFAAALAAGCAGPGGGYHTRSDGYDSGVSRGYGSYPSSQYGNSAPRQSSPVNNALAQGAGALAGGLLGAQVGRGNGRVAAAAVGAAAGAYAGGALSNPCQSELGLGHALGAIAGGLLGAQVGSGSGRIASAAVGAAAGTAIAGSLSGSSNPNCR